MYYVQSSSIAKVTLKVLWSKMRKTKAIYNGQTYIIHDLYIIHATEEATSISRRMAIKNPIEHECRILRSLYGWKFYWWNPFFTFWLFVRPEVDFGQSVAYFGVRSVIEFTSEMRCRILKSLHGFEFHCRNPLFCNFLTFCIHTNEFRRSAV